MINLKHIPSSLFVLQYYFIDIFSGSLIIISGYYTFEGDVYFHFGERLLNVVNYISKDILKFLFFILSAWAIGYLVRTSISLIPISWKKKNNKKKIRYLFDERTKLEWSNAENISFSKSQKEKKFQHWNDILSGHSRHLHILSTAGSAFIVISLLFLIAFIMKLIISDFNVFDLVMSFVFILLTVSCEIQHRKNTLNLKNIYKLIMLQIKTEDEKF